MIVDAGALTRRTFAKSLGAATLAAGIAGCRSRVGEHLVSAVERRPEVVPGISVPYATAGLREGHAIGLIVESRDGRPIKIEGHPAHPSSLGGTTAIEQASLLDLYCADRMSEVRERGVSRSANDLARAIAARPFTTLGGEGLTLLLDESTSPLTRAAIDRLLARHPRARVAFDPRIDRGHETEGARIAFGRSCTTLRDLEAVERVVVWDADPWTEGPAAVAMQKAWSRRRRASASARLVVVEPTPTVTGASADARHALRGSEIPHALAALAARVLGGALAEASSRVALTCDWIDALAADLVAHRGTVAIFVGAAQPAWAHALGHAIERALNAPVAHIAPLSLEGTHERASVRDAIASGEVDTLITAGTNPAYAWPGGLALTSALHVHLGAYRDETASVADWVVPAAHDLERWGDALGHDGTWTFLQPLLAPEHAWSVDDLLDTIAGETRSRRIDLRAAIEARGLDADDAIGRGFVPGAATRLETFLDEAAVLDALRSAPHMPASSAYEIDLRADVRMLDGRHAENAWLQELPEPSTKIVWGNAALVAPADATREHVADGHEIAIEVDGRRIAVPVHVQEGQAPGVVTLWTGFGRRIGGRHAVGVGADVTPLRSGFGSTYLTGAIRRTGATREIVRTEHDDHDAHRPRELERGEHTDPDSLYADWPETGRQWGMAIDLDLCTGCSACVIACQAENDIPVVGKTQVALGRVMHWMRIDRYVAEGGAISLQPMACQHCEHAPCEYVCPTHASVHSSDGLSQMVYNRCVGTRFCANNCPYKVRRFNFFDHTSSTPPRERLVWSPDVTVRARGVMEKCSYCVQRIRRAHITARLEDRTLEDGDVVSACEQACPSEAITFGPIDDPSARVARAHADERAYAELGELGTRPRTRYLRRRPR